MPPRFRVGTGRADKSKVGHIPPTPLPLVDFASLTRYEQLGGRGCATLVRLSTGEYYVFKGIDFRTALQYSDSGGNRLIRDEIRVWRQEHNTLQQLPPHKNILPPPLMLATIQSPDRSLLPVVCGALFPYHPAGSAASRILESNKKGLRISLRVKAHWCADMAAAVFHTHRTAKTYHKDIKPGNFIVDEDDNLMLCDWEQYDASPKTLAPEADGTWEVTEDPPAPQDTRPRLKYTKYDGPPRRNADDILEETPWHVWDVFPSWKADHPWALELAEVFSLGRSMWMLLRQPQDDYAEIQHPRDMSTDWDGCEDLPVHWMQMVDRCMSQDPNERPDLSELVDFWDTQDEWRVWTFVSDHGLMEDIDIEGRRSNDGTLSSLSGNSTVSDSD